MIKQLTIARKQWRYLKTKQSEAQKSAHNSVAKASLV